MALAKDNRLPGLVIKPATVMRDVPVMALVTTNACGNTLEQDPDSLGNI